MRALSNRLKLRAFNAGHNSTHSSSLSLPTSCASIDSCTVFGGLNQDIYTHNGTFHCDDALAVFLLRQLPQYKQSKVVRTREPTSIDSAAIVVDVGGVYDPNRNKFDHHQRGFNEVFGHGFTTKLSSAGLVYKHFGKQIVANHMKRSEEDPDVHKIWLKVYAEFMEAVDGVDNGISAFPEGTKLRYKDRSGLSARVSYLNPKWNETFTDDLLLNQFEKASAMTGSEFADRLDYYATAWLPGYQLVLNAFESRFSEHESGQIMVFESFAPWKEHLSEIEREREMSSKDHILYVLYPDTAGSSYRIQAVSVSPDSFVNRLSLPEAWCGLRDDDLSTICGIEGCIFVHASGFTGANKTKQGALSMAEKSIAESKA